MQRCEASNGRGVRQAVMPLRGLVGEEPKKFSACGKMGCGAEGERWNHRGGANTLQGQATSKVLAAAVEARI